MTSEDSMQPLLPTSLVPPPPPPHSRRRYHRCKTAPVDVGHEERDGGSLPRFGSILDQIHPSFRQVAMFLSIYVGLGTVCFYLAMNQIEGKKTDGVLDAVYFCIVTMTTVGYGDLVPNSATTKLLACGFCFTGMTLIAMILSKAADYLVEKQETLLVKTLNKHQKVRQRKLVEDIDTHKVRNKTLVVLGLLLLIVITGTIFLVAVEKLNVVDAFYCVCATITTLGYGDKSFSTKAGRVFAIFWIVTGTIVVAQFFLYIAEFSTESRRRSLVKWVLSQKMTRVELEAADLDDDGTVSASEFIIYKLKEMGKISQEDVSVVMEEFEKLDVDQSGTLTAADIFLAGQDFPENGKVKPVDPVTETLVIGIYINSHHWLAGFYSIHPSIHNSLFLLPRSVNLVETDGRGTKVNIVWVCIKRLVCVKFDGCAFSFLLIPHRLILTNSIVAGCNRPAKVQNTFWILCLILVYNPPIGILQWRPNTFGGLRRNIQI